MFDKDKDKEKTQIPVIPVQPTIDFKSVMDYIRESEDKTAITVLYELLKVDKEKFPDHLELITEWPNVSYTKMATKLSTWRTSIQEVFNLQPEDTDMIVKEMLWQFMLKMTSHKRRRSQEIVNALRKEEVGTNIFTSENKGLKRLFGLR